jgi:hypothetical protein
MSNKLDKLLLHPKSRLQLDYAIQNPPQALLISANTGAGKKTLAMHIATDILKLQTVDKLSTYPYYLHVKRLKNKSDISIEQIRAVINALRLKTPGNNNVRRVVFIEDSHFMSVPAQNTLLKILEEPSPDTIFLLSTVSELNVLPTIASRTQKIEVHSVSLNDALDYWEKHGHSKESITSAWRLSGGSTGLIHALLTEDKEHPLKHAVDEAKSFLGASKYQRLLMVDKLSRNKENFSLFLEALARTLNYLNHAAVKSAKAAQAQNILKSRKVLKQSSEALDANANARLVALKFVTNLKI